MNNGHSSLLLFNGCLISIEAMYPVPHCSHEIGYDSKRRWVVVWPWEMVNSTVDLGVWVASAFCSELEDSPVFAMLTVEERYQLIGRVAICLLGPY